MANAVDTASAAVAAVEEVAEACSLAGLDTAAAIFAERIAVAREDADVDSNVSDRVRRGG